MKPHIIFAVLLSKCSHIYNNMHDLYDDNNEDTYNMCITMIILSICAK